MTTTTPAQITAAVLEQLVESPVPCGGVKSLSIPPCGSAAKFMLNRRNADHPCSTGAHISDFKCQGCYEMWLSSTVEAFMASGYVTCVECRCYFDSITEFARYLPL